MQLQHCQTGQIVHSIDDERLTQKGNINCYRMQLSFVKSLQYECQVERLIWATLVMIIISTLADRSMS